MRRVTSAVTRSGFMFWTLPGRPKGGREGRRQRRREGEKEKRREGEKEKRREGEKEGGREGGRERMREGEGKGEINRRRREGEMDE